MNRSRFLLNAKKSELKLENEAENVSKLRASRFVKSSRYLFNATKDYFQIRKPLNLYMIEELNAFGRKTYFQRVFILALNIEEHKLAELWQNSNLKLAADFREYLQRYMSEIFAACDRRKCTADQLTGLVVVMGSTHTLLVIEGAEDMIANFFEELDLVHDKIWINAKVFLVEDRIGETYFNCFYSHRSQAININEKFPTSIANDYKQMAGQHLKIKEKLKNLVETISTLRKGNDEARGRDTLTDSFYLPADPFNKLLPEIQRIDLVLNANKFYHNLRNFSQTYRVLQVYQDEDSYLWPIQNNYMPLEIFKRSEFDVNLTFGAGGKQETQEKPENVSHDIQKQVSVTN